MTHLSVHTPIPFALGHAALRPTRCFAIDEIAWMREEAVAIARRMNARAVRDVHRLDSGFARLAAHHRIIDLVERTIGGRAVLSGSVLHFADAPALAAVPHDCVRVIVDLGPSPDAIAPRTGFRGLGDVWVQDADGDLGAFDDQLILVVDFHRDAGRGHTLSTDGDDSLWPHAAFCAG